MKIMFYLMTRYLISFLLFWHILIENSFSQLITDPFEGPKEICSSIDIWYNVTEFSKLKDCKVIIGNLEIAGLSGFNESSYRRLTFPKLREVTGYVLLYRVDGLTTLSRLFPNLTLIRGHRLIADYALIIFEVADLKEIGLRSLKSIERGRVRIERNYQVCFVETIDWKEISGRSGHRIETYTICPGNVPCRACANNACWNSRSCQSLEVCHQECLGCSHINKSMCHRCQHYLDKNICVTSCPSNKVILEEAKYCLTPEECSSLFDGNSFVWNNTCIKECPTGYKKERIDGHLSCESNTGANKMICDGMRVFTLDDLQKADNCQVIKGPFILHITDNKTTPSLLQKYLGKIEVINDFLKIYGSPTIQSLDFFTNLKQINGQNLMRSNYSVLIYDMINLKTRLKSEVKVQRGYEIYLHNDQLCDLTKTSVLSSETNKFNALCGYKKIEFYDISDILNNSINITFSSVKDNSDSNIKQYKLSYTKNSDDTLSTNSRLCCDKRKWKVINLATDITDGQNITISVKFPQKNTIITQAHIFFIEYFSLPKSELESPAMYGKSEVRLLQVKPLYIHPPMPYLYFVNSTTDSVHLAWRTLGNVANANYIIEMMFVDNDLKYTEKLNYCKMSKLKKLLRHKKEFHKMSTGLSFLNCDQKSEPNNDGEIGIADLNDLYEIYLRNLLHSNNNNIVSLSPKENKKRNDKYLFIRDATKERNIVMKNLISYGYYTIKIQVCIDDYYKVCSQKSQDVVRMKSNPNLKKLTVNTTANDHEISLYWNDPSNMSDVVSSYFIQIKSNDNTTKETILNSDFCVTRKDHEMNNYSYLLNAESDGDYHISITAISLSGVRNTSSSFVYVRSIVETNQGYVALIWIFSTTLISLLILKGYCIWKSRQAATVQEDTCALVNDLLRNSVGLEQYERDVDGLFNSS